MKPRALLPIGMIGLTIIGCQFLTSAGGSTGGGSTPPPDQEGVSADLIRNIPMERPVTALIALRSVRISMETARPDGSGVRIEAEVDASGNYHLIKSLSGEPPGRWPTPSSTGEAAFPSAIELAFVDGIAYESDSKGGFQKITGTGFEKILESILRSPDGPGLWLAVLPKNSLSVEGSEEIGGFSARRYSVRGDMEGSTITGTVWLDIESGALIGSDFNIPASLYGPYGTTNSGVAEITLEVSREEIAPITVTGG